MGGTSSVSRNRYEYSESTDIAPEDIARALREVQEQQNMNKALPDYLAAQCYFTHPSVDYRFEKKIGEGAFSNVYKASQLNKQGQVVMRNFSDDPDNPNWRPMRYAIKEIDLKNLSLQQLQNVEKEVQILSQLNHPDIVRMHALYLCSETQNPARVQRSGNSVAPIDIVSQKGKKSQLFLVLEYLQGGELLRAVCQRKRYTEDDARQLMLQILEGIRYIHSRGVIHRDIKPENLILNKKNLDSNIKIVDFGFATLTDEQDKLFQAEGARGTSNGSNSLSSTTNYRKGVSGSGRNFLCGTQGYMAPEVLLDRNYTTKCDMWAVGVVMYILLSGTMPFAINDNKSVLNGAYSFPASRWANVSDSAKNLIGNLLTVDPSARLNAEGALQHPWMCTPKRIPLAIYAKSGNDLSQHHSINGSDVSAQGENQVVSHHSSSSVHLDKPARHSMKSGENGYSGDGFIQANGSTVSVTKSGSQVSQTSMGELTQNLKSLRQLTIRQKFRRGLTAVRSAVRFKLSGLIRQRRRSNSEAAVFDTENETIQQIAAEKQVSKTVSERYVESE